MIKLLNLLVDTTPGLSYHLKHELPISENVYRYSSKAFIELFAEARTLHRDGYLQLCEEDRLLLETTDIGEYGIYEGQEVPLDLPMIQESLEVWPSNIEGNDGIIWIKTKEYKDGIVNYIPYYRGHNIDYGGVNFSSPEKLEAYIKSYILSNNLYNKYKYEKEKPLPNILPEAEYRGKEVALNKPKRGGPKKFYVYTKNAKGNVVKVNFGGTTGLNVKIDEPGARASFAARHKCSTKKDKTKPGYWACNIGRYWKSLGGSKNFSGYW